MRSLRFDYEAVDWRFIAGIMNRNSLRLSRTRKGRLDTGSSNAKTSAGLSGDELKRRSTWNESRAFQFLYETRNAPAPTHAADVRALLDRVASMVTEGLLPDPEQPLRTWEIGANQRSTDGKEPVAGGEAKVSPEDLPAAMDAFCAEVHQRWGDLVTDPVPVAAWVEWELNGGALHPFYDGCGRISRIFSGMLMVRASWLLPLYDDRASYFEHGNRGLDTFVDYVRERIEACAAWLAECSKAREPDGTCH